MNLTALCGGGFMIYPLNMESGTKSFLKNNPFIVCQPDGFSSVCFFDDSNTMNQKKQKRILSTVNASGVNKLFVYQLNGDSLALPFSGNPPLPVQVRRINPTTQKRGSGISQLASAG